MSPREHAQAFIRMRVEVASDGCWNWTRYVGGDGYARTTYRNPDDPTFSTTRPNRLSYWAFVGDIPDGLHIDHLCSNRACVNPAHLEPVTRDENNRRARAATLAAHAKRAALITHCKRGHELSGANLRMYRDRRHCRACQYIHTANYRARKESA